MIDQNAVPLIVLSAARDPVETINGILRRAGHPVHCTWIPSLRDLGDALTQLNPELLLYAAHGVLHLCGLDDRTAAGFREMHRKEDEILTRLGVGPVFDTSQSTPSRKQRGRRS